MTAVVVVLVYESGIPAGLARQSALRRLEAGAVSQAQRWLARAGRLDPGDGRTDLLRAACFRHQGRFERWREAVRAAQRKRAPAGQVQQELRLGLIQSGAPCEEVEQEWAALIESGISPHEVAAAFIHRYLGEEEAEKAKVALDGWSANYPNDHRVAYMTGVYWRWRSQPGRAEAAFKEALERQSRHELARGSLAALLEEQNRLQEALVQYLELAALADDPGSTRLSVARLLRKLGRLDEAQAELASLASRPAPSSSIALETGQIELERGNYQEAQRRFEEGGLDRAVAREVLTGAACAFGLEGEPVRADQTLARLDALIGRSARAFDLQSRLAVAPDDVEAAAELRRMSVPPTGEGASRRRSPPATEKATETAAGSLYAVHCAACHGASGDGNGRAARHLFPRPRDLRTGKSRLVSSRNGIPTGEDRIGAVRQGMPGTAMRSFEDLNENELRLLAEELLRLNREGIRKQFIDALERDGEEVDEEEVREVVELSTTPGEAVDVPRIGPPDSQAIARGHDIYIELGCDNCHGEDGTGASDTPLFDDKGRPCPPRDLVREPFKGGDGPESTYLRVFVGMPGTPHPGCWNVPNDRLVDLVHYCRGLAREPQRVSTNHQRALQAPLAPQPSKSARIFSTSGSMP